MSGVRNGTRQFWLTLRLTPQTRQHRRAGFDGVFRCEYMGFAEFEYGAIPKSLRRMRDASNVLTVLPIDGQNVYFVHAEGIDPIDDFLEWFTDPGGPRSKDETYFPDVLAGTQPEWVGTRAWWSLTDDVMWTLDAGLADEMLMQVNR